MESRPSFSLQRSTPTPPPEDYPMSASDAQDIFGEASPSGDALAPLAAEFPLKAPLQYAPFGSSSPPKASPRSPQGATLSPYSGFSDAGSSAGSENARNPFNFQTVAYAPGQPTQLKPDAGVGRRRGHKYKHSSVSHQIFLEPAQKTPLALPTSIPIPTFREYRKSFSKDQQLRGLWCFCHLLIAGYVQWSGHGSLAMTALSHLLFFDALGAFLEVAVDVGGNFEVWKRSSIRYPFGLERAEVLAGLALAIGLLFMGLDLISHNLQHSLENVGGHEPHHATHHPFHDRVPAGSVDVAALAAIVATLVSASLLGNHARIGRALRFNLPLPSFLANPSHLLTLSCSGLMLLLPLLSMKMYRWVDVMLSMFIATSMGFLGARMAFALGKMLLMSLPGAPGGAGAVVADIETDEAVGKVEEARFWQVHYGLCMANLKVTLRDAGSRTEDEVLRVRDKISSLVRNRLGGGYGGGKGAVRWEVSTQIMLEGQARAHSHSHG